MSTRIEWCLNPDGSQGITWNPVTGCSKISDGCTNCYARTMAMRLKAMGVKKYINGFDVTCHENELYLPKFQKTQTIFVCSMSDLFHEKIPFEFIRRIFVSIRTVLRDGLDHRFIILTKRPQRMLEFWLWNKREFGKYPNVHLGDEKIIPNNQIWLGTTVENQEMADKRIPVLLQVPAAVHLVSIEPMLGLIDLRQIDAEKSGHKEFIVIDSLTGKHTDMGRPCPEVPKLDWVIMGAESGPRRRPMKIEWAKNIAKQCLDAGVPLFYKQGPDDYGNDFVKMPILLNRAWAQMPEAKP